MLHTPLVALRGRYFMQCILRVCCVAISIQWVSVTLLCAAEKTHFDVAAGAASETLKEAAEQADVPFMYVPSKLQGVMTRAINGAYEPVKAFELMLDGSSLTVVWHKRTGAFTLRKVSRKQLQKENRDKMKETTEKQRLLGGLFHGLLAIALANSPELAAQKTDAENEEIFELSPFSVDASDNEGYYAPNTLAGTRINSQLKDLGTSIQVVTAQFLEDIGATDSSDLLIYTTNTETGGESGNFSGLSVSAGRTDTRSSRENPQGAQRVRGLFTADLTRNYFKTILPFDSYNTTRIDINRGSNANLFGLGSPAGIINNQLFEASHSNFGKFGARFGEQSSQRYTFDLNREIVKDKFSIRTTALYDDKKYKQKPAYKDTERYFIAGRFDPFENTTIKAHFESGRVRANRPDPVAPKENISGWLLIGKPLLNNLAAYGGPNAPGTGIFVDIDGDGTLEEAPASIVDAANFRVAGTDVNGVPLNDGKFTIGGNGMVTGPQFATVPGTIRPPRVDAARTFQQGVLVWSDPTSRNPDTAGFIASIPNNLRAAGDALDADGVKESHVFRSVRNLDRFFSRFNRQGFAEVQGANFDFVNNLFAGTTPFQHQDFENINYVVEQTFLENRLGFELAFDYQEYESDAYTPVQDNASSIWVDINTALPDGRPNPNLGRPFVNGRASKGTFNTEQESFRATAFYKHNFEEQFGDSFIGKLLGEHNLSSLYETRDFERTSAQQRLVWGDEQVLRALGRPGNHSHFASMINPYFYVGPSLLGIDSLDDVTINPIIGAELWRPGETSPITFWDPGANPDGTPSKDPDAILANGQLVTKDSLMAEHTRAARYSKEEVTSAAGILQSFFWGGNLVTTVGYREDEVDLQTITGAPTDNLRNEIPSRLIAEGSSNTISPTISEDRWNWGAVFHLPESIIDLPLDSSLSFHYAESSNFQPLAGRVDFDNRPLGSPSGETEERGFTISTFENKLHFRVNWYETALTGKSAQGALGQLTNNVVYQNADFAFRTSSENTDPQYAALNQAAGFAILANATDGENARFSPVLSGGDPNNPTGVEYGASVGASDTEDVAASGMEVEIIYNPTRNWRIAINVAEQETIRANMFPISSNELVPLRDELAATPVPGFEWLTIGELRRNGTLEENTIFDPANQIYTDADGAPITSTIANHLEGDSTQNKIFLRTAKAAEGSIATEQRRWRANLITNYSFTEGRLSGISVGGAYRWQDEVSIGFPFITNSDGQTVGDVANPFFADSEGNVDLWIGYKVPLFQDFGRWKLQLNVRNALASESDFIPLQSQPDGTFSRVRFAPQREMFLSSTFAF